MGIVTVMLTGDNKRTATAVAKKVGVDAVISDVLPDEKEAVIKRLSEQGNVAMVGDGINDAPAVDKSGRRKSRRSGDGRRDRFCGYSSYEK